MQSPPPASEVAGLERHVKPRFAPSYVVCVLIELPLLHLTTPQASTTISTDNSNDMRVIQCPLTL